MCSDSDDDSGSVPMCVFFSPAARVPIEETVETKELEMREEIPTKGTAEPCKKCKLFCPTSATIVFVLCCLLCNSCYLFDSLLFLAVDRLIALSTVVACSCLCYLIFCCASLLYLQINSISLVMLTQSVSFKFLKLRKSLKRSQHQL